ncbi:cytochrome ubiquinol oxidase subunit I [Priestia taiwanensis]|uniref:Cytochrome ubiquinol oxidase subunit I n=1 Tax=Priestia taiwanensis TaxID=1347902 RepID=A0A917ASS8_9BACI|nr:cytochrome ubiquinol oxidase subunit I [Priestia taiwanensis]MBM7364281.1 cytochrome d ubiquinol oxidase subunit I [Priestia taiwanensis]GGE73187.1 cytochrome ubiquinol oxidase subunit I [Priestia taiwanensis]
MDTVVLARMFFGSSLAFHIIFATLAIGLSLMIFIFEILYQVKKDNNYAIMAKRLTKGFAILLGVAIPTGTIVGVQLSLLWPGFAEIVGQVIAVPFQIEIFAFFLEALFMSIYVYAADKLPRYLRLISLFFVMFGATASAVLITSANTWMNTPAGFSVADDGTIYNVDPWRAFFNPSFFVSSWHVVITAFATGACVVAALAGFKLLRRKAKHQEFGYYRKGLYVSLVVAAITGTLMMFSGHSSAVMLHEHSPEKLAAAEGLIATQANAGLTIGGFVNPDTLEMEYGLEVPGALSILAGGTFDTVVKGLEEFPRETWPPFYTHVLFNLMVGLGSLMFGIVLFALFMWWLYKRKQSVQLPKWLLWLVVSLGPVSILAIEFGWIFSCSGRQPWTIYGVQRVTNAATRADYVGELYFLFVILYIVLAILTVVVLISYFKRHPLAKELETYGGKNHV